MDLYFARDINVQPFLIFSSEHIITFVVVCLINAGFILFFKKCRNETSLKFFRLSVAWVLLINEFSYILWSIITGDWSIDYSLPLQLCEILTFLIFYMLITGNYLFFEISYFITFGAALQAIITPDLYYPFPHYRFFNFFLSHGLMFTAIFYMLIVKKYKPTFKSVWRTMAALNIYMVILLPVDLLTHGNYMFLLEKPIGGSVLDFLGPWPWYLVSLEFVGLFILMLCYAPFAIMNYYNKKRGNKNYNNFNNISLNG